MKKMLYITHLSGRRLNRFWNSSINAAQELGYEFHLACNMGEAEHPYWDRECKEFQVITHQIDFNRNPLNMQNIRAAKQLIELLNEETFDIVHCNTPVGGLVGRICAYKVGVPKIIYQAHGFHFWKGAHLRNWIIYYPVEKWLARMTDVLITINKEDYEVANHFKAKKVVFVPGIGVNTNLFYRRTGKNEKLREKLQIPSTAEVLLSVGELIKRKNHRIVIEALPNLRNTWYIVCGQGPLYDEYKDLANKLGINDRVVLTGYKTDLEGYYNMADIFVLPSYQEGLSVALMEAMSSELPCVVSDIRGNKELIEDNEWRFDPYNVEALKSVLLKAINNENWRKQQGKNNRKKIDDYRIEIVIEALKEIYSSSV